MRTATGANTCSPMSKRYCEIEEKANRGPCFVLRENKNAEIPQPPKCC